MIGGEVVFFNNSGKYGFIELGGDTEDVFFHLNKTKVYGSGIEEGGNVKLEFSVEEKGPVADIIVIDSTEKIVEWCR